jgi:ribonuclease HI
MLFWSVASTIGNAVRGVLSGAMTEREAGPQRGNLHDHLDRAVRRVRADAAETVYCAESTSPATSSLEAALGRRGFPTSSDYPPASGLTTTGSAVEDLFRSFYRRVEVSTDASAGKSGWTGTGWMIDFGQGSRPRLGHQARRGGNILEAELRAIFLGVQDAIRLVPHGLADTCMLVVRSDSKWALRMIDQPGWRPVGTSRTAVDLVESIRIASRGRSVHFTWIRAHHGDLGNETADRLALMSRRHAEHDLPAESLTFKVDALRCEVHDLGTSAGIALAA